jgi:hypothetical protein
VEKAWFDDKTRAILKCQLAQHVQLLAQTYAMTATREEPKLKTIALNAKRMIVSLFSWFSSLNIVCLMNIIVCRCRLKLEILSS